MRQQHPIITIWDDHEVANNTYTEGAQNHQADKEGDFRSRKEAAKKAYYEWIPIRESPKLYRQFSYGSLAEVIMLDERLEGRTKPSEGITDPLYNSEDRTMLGAEQLQWFQDKLKTASADWKIIGNQVIFSDVDRSRVSPNNPRNMDSWDGYPAEKKKIAGYIQANNIRNVIFLTGDTHSSWAFEVVVNTVTNKSSNNKHTPLAVEFGTTSITSANGNESTTDDTVKIREQTLMQSNPHLKFTNQRDHGYLVLTLYPEKARADWYYVRTLEKPDHAEYLAKSIELQRNANRLKVER
jgi:alkaline phosphatase D